MEINIFSSSSICFTLMIVNNHFKISVEPIQFQGGVRDTVPPCTHIALKKIKDEFRTLSDLKSLILLEKTHIVSYLISWVVT